MRCRRVIRFLVLAVAVSSCRPAGPPSRVYATHADAVTAGEVSRGVLPAWVPIQATEIHIQDGGEGGPRWLRFRLPDSARGALQGQLRSVPDSSLPDLASQRPGVSWWFQHFIQVEPADDGALNAWVYQGTGSPIAQAAYLAFDQASDLVYLWWEAGR